MSLVAVARSTPWRLTVAGFCWVSAGYAFTSASPFAYRQLLAPRVFPLIALFADWHALLYWVWLLMAIAGLGDVLRRRGAARRLAIGFALFGAVAGLTVAAQPILPALVDDRRSLIVGLTALLPVFWLALIDYVDLWQAAVSPIRERTESVGWDEGRLLIAALSTAVFVSIVDAAFTPLAIAGRFEPDLLTLGLVAGLGWNLIDQAVVCCGVFLMVALGQRIARHRSFGARYAVLLLVLVLLGAWLAEQTVYNALGFNGAWLAVVSTVSAASVLLTWGAQRLRHATRDRARIATPLELFFGPPVGVDDGVVRRLAPFLALAATAYAVAAVSRMVDWDFLLLKCGVFAVWAAVLDRMFRSAPPEVRVGAPAVALACLTPLLLYAATPALAGSALVPRHALDRYSVYNPSFRVVDGLLRDTTLAGDDRFQAFLRANTGLGREVDVSPAEVVFSSLDEAAPAPPHIFLFVIDSLRRDYLQPYDESIGFTPSLARFGHESVVFRNSFSAYGGTGLSVPAIWSGSVGPHKQYVTPFAPMNSLEKVLRRNNYRQFITFDSVVRQLVPRSSAMTELDADSKSEDVTFCRTVGELTTRLEMTADDPRPVFAYSLPQDLHVSNIIGASVPAGESYPGFHAPYAARVRRIDSCFGAFVDFLKRRGWYDRSLIVVTADHGEMLGEEGRWGHVYYLFPQVIQVPLIVHFPAGTAPTGSLDPDSVSLTIDITPTIYAALGYQPRRDTPLMGRSLIGRAVNGAGDTIPVDDTLSDRDRAGSVLAASYSAVYAVIRAHGRQLYIVDAVQHREFAYQREAGSSWIPAPVTAGLREVAQRRIREHIYDVNRVYRITRSH